VICHAPSSYGQLFLPRPPQTLGRWRKHLPEHEYKKESTKDFFQTFANRCSQVAGSRWAFLSAVLLIIIWAATGPIFGYSDAWQLVVNTATTIITFLMVFLIQNAQNRDSHALHLKLDEIIRAKRSANNKMIDIEKLSDEELTLLATEYERIRKECDNSKKSVA
jgi:low affinity Fe/Cu permease